MVLSEVKDWKNILKAYWVENEGDKTFILSNSMLSTYFSLWFQFISLLHNIPEEKRVTIILIHTHPRKRWIPRSFLRLLLINKLKLKQPIERTGTAIINFSNKWQHQIISNMKFLFCFRLRLSFHRIGGKNTFYLSVFFFFSVSYRKH